MQYRRITVDDVEQVAAFAAIGLRPHLYPLLHVSMDKVRAVVKHFATSDSDFNLGAFVDGQIVAGIAAVVQPMLYHERSECQVVMCRSESPGAGRHIIKALRDWTDADMRIRRTSFAQEFDVDPRMLKLLARYGFAHQQSVLHYYKG